MTVIVAIEERLLSAKAIDFVSREFIAALIFWMSRMALKPMPLYRVRLR
jgi:hypothetical protein